MFLNENIILLISSYLSVLDLEKIKLTNDKDLSEYRQNVKRSVVSISDSKGRTKVFEYIFNTEIKDGLYIEDYSRNKVIATFLNGRKDGVERYYENIEGKEILKTETRYRNGRKEGHLILYHDNGNIKMMQNYSNDILEGESKMFYENGKLSARAFYFNNVFHGVNEFYYKNGNVESSTDFKNGIKDGNKTEYYKDGKIKYITEYKNNFKNGTYSEYYENGNIKFTKNYVNNIIKGKFEEYYENGNLKVSSNLINIENKEKLDGEYLEYYESGKLKISGKYISGMKEGLFQTFDENGKVILEETYLLNIRIY